MQESKRTTEVAGLVTSVLRKDSKLVQLAIQEGDANKDVEFPFAGDDLALKAFTNVLVGNRVKYWAEMTDWFANRTDYGLIFKYRLDVLEGPLKGAYQQERLA